jgi:hypothetical protein
MEAAMVVEAKAAVAVVEAVVVVVVVEAKAVVVVVEAKVAVVVLVLVEDSKALVEEAEKQEAIMVEEQAVQEVGTVLLYVST